MSLDQATETQTPSVVPVPADFAENAHIDAAKYEEMYAASIADPATFWGEHGKRLDWIKPFTKVKNTINKPKLKIRVKLIWRMVSEDGRHGCPELTQTDRL